MSINQDIRTARIQAGYTQEMLAEKTDLSLRTIQRIEKGDTHPRAHTLNNISKVLDLQVNGPDAITIKPKSKVNDGLFFLKISALGLSFLPFVNIIATITLWKFYGASAEIKEEARLTLTLQILTSICLVIALLLFPILSYISHGQSQVGNFPVFTLLYILYVCSNIYWSIKTPILPVNFN